MPPKVIRSWPPPSRNQYGFNSIVHALIVGLLAGILISLIGVPKNKPRSYSLLPLSAHQQRTSQAVYNYETWNCDTNLNIANVRAVASNEDHVCHHWAKIMLSKEDEIIPDDTRTHYEVFNCQKWEYKSPEDEKGFNRKPFAEQEIIRRQFGLCRDWARTLYPLTTGGWLASGLKDDVS